MSDEDDILLREAFGELTDLARPAIRPAGLGAARARAVQRRNHIVVAVALAVVVVLALPVALLSPRLLRGASVAPGGSTAATTPSVAPSRVWTASTDGAGVLANATVALPYPPITLAQGPVCGPAPLTYQDGQFTFEDGVVGHEWQATIVASATADIDADGTADVVAQAHCTVASTSIYLIAALSHQPNGSYTTLGAVVIPGVEPDPAITGTAQGFQVSTDGHVQVQVTYTNMEDHQVDRQWQQREYAWNGHQFTLIA